MIVLFRKEVTPHTVHSFVGCRYSQHSVREAIDKINNEIPGLFNSENQELTAQLADWIDNKLMA